MADVNEITQVNRTNDGRFTVNQKEKGTKIEDLRLFKIADRDKNEVLSADEIRRYNSPILFVHEGKKNVASVALFTDNTKEGIAKGGIYLNSFKYIEGSQQDFYAELKRDDVINKEEFLHKFDTIDSNKDKEISEDEMHDVVNIGNLGSESMHKLSETKKAGFIISFGGLLLGLMGGLIVPALSKNPLVRKLTGLIAAGSAILGAVATDIPLQMSVKKIAKEYNESMGEYKDHEYARDRWDKQSKATGFWGLFAM